MYIGVRTGQGSNIINKSIVFTAFGTCTLNVRTNISSYGP